MDLIDARLIDRLHGGMPLTERPYADVARELGLSESEVLARLHQMLDNGTLTRFGPLFQIERAGGQFLLAAMAVPEDRFDEVTRIVNALPEVAHNYRRTHQLNMWFVVGAESPAAVLSTCEAIEAATGLKVHAFPKEKEFFVELRLSALATLAPQATEASPSTEIDHEPVRL